MNFCHHTDPSPILTQNPPVHRPAAAVGRRGGEKGDIGRQTEQVLANIQTALEAGGADLADVVKWNVYVVQGQPLQPASEAFQRAWGTQPDPPAITVAIAIGLARPVFLAEMDAVAVVVEQGQKSGSRHYCDVAD